MGLFDQKGETPSSREPQMTEKSRGTSFDWLVKRAEADLGVAQALAAGESQRANQIERLETTLIGQINTLQHQIIETRERELDDLKAEIFACAGRIARFEDTHSTAAATKQVVQELGDLRAQLTERQTELENRHSGFEQLGESLNAHVRALADELRDKLDGIRTAQAEMRHFQSETQSLAQRVAHAEAATGQARTLAVRNLQQLEQTSESLRAEIVALNALFAEFNDKRANPRSPENLLAEVAQNLGAKIEEIENRLNQEHPVQLGRDARLGQLDSGLALLAERMTKAEALSQKTHALTAAELDSAAEFRQSMARALAALQAQLDDPSHQTAVDELEASLRARADQWQHQAAQKFMLLDSRDAEREKTARDLAATLAAELTEREARSDEKLRALARDCEELGRLRPAIESLAQRVVQTESAAERLQAQADSGVNQTAELEDGLKSAIAALSTEVAKLDDQQRAFSLSEDRRRESASKHGIKLDEIQRQMASERDGFDHWGKGLRESFGAELSAIQTRLSERQSQIEHRYARLEGGQETFKANLDALAARLKENLQPQAQEHEPWNKLWSELGALGERMSELESRAREAEQRANLIRADTEHSAAPCAHAIAPDAEQALRTKMDELDQQLAERFTRIDARDAERDRQANQSIETLQSDLAALTAVIKQRAEIPAESAPGALQESIATKMKELQEYVAEKWLLLDQRDGERDQQAEQAMAKFKSEITALNGELIQRPIAISPADPALRSMEENLTAKIAELREQMGQKFNALDSCAADLQDLKERSQSWLQRETQLSAAVEPSQKTPIFSAQAGDSAAEIHARSEKEQLIKLQERMSSEIERVRAELKERSGRWKVRKSASETDY